MVKEKEKEGEEKIYSEKETAMVLEDTKINIKIKLTALWAPNMFLFMWIILDYI